VVVPSECLFLGIAVFFSYTVQYISQCKIQRHLRNNGSTPESTHDAMIAFLNILIEASIFYGQSRQAGQNREKLHIILMKIRVFRRIDTHDTNSPSMYL